MGLGSRSGWLDTARRGCDSPRSRLFLVLGVVLGVQIPGTTRASHGDHSYSMSPDEIAELNGQDSPLIKGASTLDAGGVSISEGSAQIIRTRSADSHLPFRFG